MKNETTGMTTFGDWSAEYYIYKANEYFTEERPVERRDHFMTIFGTPNDDGRYSWSGSCFPKIDACNEVGQEMFVDSENNIVIHYSYSKDTRADKEQIVPEAMRQEELVLATWSADMMREKLESKFNKLG